METGIGRRVFVGSVVAGLPMLGASTVRGAAPFALQAPHVHGDVGVRNPVLEHIVRQMAAAHNGLRRELKGEPLRAFAAQLRTLAVYGRSIDLDTQVKSALTALIERDGRDQVLYTQSDRARTRAELKAYGVDRPDERILNVAPSLDYAQRSAVLNRLMTSGPTAQWDRLAAVLERSAQEVDRRGATVWRVSRQDTVDPEYWKGFCQALWDYLEETRLLTGLHCAAAVLPIIGVAIVPLCAAYTLAMLILGMTYAGNCLNV